jgi:hypothetical protein
VGRQIDRLVPLRIRAAALMPAAVLTVHQLRFQLAFGERADSKLASEGHQYLGAFLAPLAAMALAVGVGLFLATLARARRRGADENQAGPASSFPRIWLLAAVSLLAIYCAQELLEGLLASGHPGGLAGVFGEGGLWAIPLSVLLGAVVALGLRIAEVAICWAEGCRARPPSHPAPPRRLRRPGEIFLAPRGPLADSAAGRAPPALASATS